MEESPSEISSLKPANLWQLSCYNFIIFLTSSPFLTTSSLWLLWLKLTWTPLLTDWPSKPLGQTSHQREEEERLFSVCIAEGQEMSGNRTEEQLCSGEVWLSVRKELVASTG